MEMCQIKKKKQLHNQRIFNFSNSYLRGRNFLQNTMISTLQTSIRLVDWTELSPVGCIYATRSQTTRGDIQNNLI